MKDSANKFTIYIRNENMDAWKRLGKFGFRGAFINWALKYKYGEHRPKEKAEPEQPT